jgi:regulator of replication initiation timing
MARKIKRRTGRKSRRSIKRSIKRDLEKSLRKTIERSIKKSLNKFNKRIKKYKKKKTKKKKIQRGGDATSLISSIQEVFKGEQINTVEDLKAKVETLKREYDNKRNDRALPKDGKEIYQALDTHYFDTFTGGEKWSTTSELERLKTDIKEHIYAYLKGEIMGVNYDVFPNSIDNLSKTPKKYALNLQSATAAAAEPAAAEPAAAELQVDEPEVAEPETETDSIKDLITRLESVLKERNVYFMTGVEVPPDKVYEQGDLKKLLSDLKGSGYDIYKRIDSIVGGGSIKADIVTGGRLNGTKSLKNLVEELEAEALAASEPEPAAAPAAAPAPAPAADPAEAARQAAAEEAARQAAAEEAARQAAAEGRQDQGGDQPELGGSEPCNISSDAKNLVEELKKCRREKADNEQNILALREESRGNDAAITENEQKIADNEAQIAQLKGEKAGLEHQIGELRAELQRRGGVNDELSDRIQELETQLQSATGEIGRIQQDNQQLGEENTALARERQNLQAKLDVATQGRADGEERLKMLQAMINDLIKKRICSLLGEVIIAIALDPKATTDINSEMDGPSVERFINGYGMIVTWKRLLVSLMKLAIIRGYNLDSVLGLYGGDIDVHEINKDLGEDEKIILRSAIPELSGSEGFPDE